VKFSSKMDEEITFWLTLPPPVLFGDTVATPLECHVLFELPLTELWLREHFIKGKKENLQNCVIFFEFRGHKNNP